MECVHLCMSDCIIIPGKAIGCRVNDILVRKCKKLDDLVTGENHKSSRREFIKNWNSLTRAEYSGRSCKHCKHKQLPTAPLRFIRRVDLLTDIEALAAQIPPDVAAIAGVPRSGLMVAADLAIRLSLPLLAVSPAGLAPIAAGHRLTELPDRTGPLLVVEDSTNSGDSLSRAVQVAAAAWPNPVITAAVYANPSARYQPDMVCTWLPTPHLFEWHLFGSSMASRIGWDIDGVLFREKAPHGPLYVPRGRRVPLIATGRHERHRAATSDWLATWGITYDRLVMYDGDTDDPDQYRGLHKAAAYQAAANCRYFVESCPTQARTIADISGKPVICPSTGEVFQ